MPATVATYSPLSGTEVKESILTQIRKELENHPDLVNHLAYPRVTWSWTLDLETYPFTASTPHTDVGNTLGDPKISTKPKYKRIRRVVQVGTDVSPEQIRKQLTPEIPVEEPPAEHIISSRPERIKS